MMKLRLFFGILTASLLIGCSGGGNSGGPANCYVVSKSGSYSFPAVKGNSDIPVGDVASVDVLWESFGTSEAPDPGALIASVSLDGDKIRYTTAPEFREGNALIAARDAAGTILWSWHIWMTDMPADQKYMNNAGVVMDRHLGATSATPGEAGTNGLLYQWGRKDPFLGADENNRKKAKSSGSAVWRAESSSASVGTIEFAVANPMTFIKYNSANNDWFYSKERGVTDDTRWASVKTMYDPCPAGYRVPDGGAEGLWSRALGVPSYEDAGIYDEEKGGFEFGKGKGVKSLMEDLVCWYPAAGVLVYSDSRLTSAGSAGHCWTCTVDGQMACTFDANNPRYSYGDNIYAVNSSVRSLGYSVRCVKE